MILYGRHCVKVVMTVEGDNVVRPLRVDSSTLLSYFYERKKCPLNYKFITHYWGKKEKKKKKKLSNTFLEKYVSSS